MSNRFTQALASIAPGIFMAGYIIGTGSVTTMAIAGAHFGMSLTWALLLSCLFNAFLMLGISRLTIVSGDTLLYNFKTHIHPAVSIVLIAGFALTIVTSIMGVTAIVVSVLEEWSAGWLKGRGIPQPFSASLILGVLCLLFIYGRHQTFVKVLALFVGGMGLCFVITMFLVVPDSGDILAGLVPRIPDSGQPHIVIAGMVGTTMAGVCLFSRSILVNEQNWTTNDFKAEHRDTAISMLLTFFLSASIIAACAGTLYANGIRIENAVDMMQALEPLAGRFAITLFAIGILCAGMSSILPNMLLIPWIYSDYAHKKRDTRNLKIRFVVILITLTGLTVPLFGGRPIQLMVLSQAISPVVMPILNVCLLILLNRSAGMRNYKAGTLLNLGISIALLFNLVLSYIALSGFIQNLSD